MIPLFPSSTTIDNIQPLRELSGHAEELLIVYTALVNSTPRLATLRFASVILKRPSLMKKETMFSLRHDMAVVQR
jgi:hypothetical protein